MIRDDGLSESYATSEYEDGDSQPDQAEAPPHPLDSPKMDRLLARIKEWYEQELERQAFNRFQMAMDSDFYDSLQWSEEDAMVLAERGQAPVVYNEIKSSIDWMIGTERRTRIDYKVLPRRKEDSDQAEVKTKLLKYLSDVNHEPMARSEAFAQACKSGMGWLEVGVRGDSTDEPIYYRAQSWRYMLYDSNSEALALSDARYLFRWKWVDKDMAEAFFRDRAEVVSRSAIDGDRLGNDEDDLWYMGARVTEPGEDYTAPSKYAPYDGSAFSLSRRDRVKLIECWYREPKKVQVSVPGLDGESTIHDRIELEVRCAIYCDGGLLWEGPSPYKHGRFPLVPVWAFRRNRDNAPYGPIRSMRDPQEGMNKRMSKALWILSSNQVEMEEGAVDDIEDLRDEVARPDGIIIRARGKELNVLRDNQLAAQHLDLMERDRNMIRAVGGVTGENLGRETNADSGKAIIARQEQGGVVTTELFDNFRFAVQLAGEIELSLVEQFYDQPRIVRLVGDRGNAEFVPINEPDPQTGEILNDITASEADFHLAQQDYRDTMRMAMFESLLDIVSRLAQMAPEVAFKLLDLVVEMADIPNREELVARIRQLNGMRDPDSEPSPEEQQQMQAQAQEQAMQKELMLARAQAELAELQAKAGKLDADAIDKRLEAMRSALESAQAIAMAPALGPVADDLMSGAGYVDKGPSTEIANVAEQQNAQAAAAQMQQQAAMEQQAMAEQQQPMQGQGQDPRQASVQQAAEEAQRLGLPEDAFAALVERAKQRGRVVTPDGVRAIVEGMKNA